MTERDFHLRSSQRAKFSKRTIAASAPPSAALFRNAGSKLHEHRRVLSLTSSAIEFETGPPLECRCYARGDRGQPRRAGSPTRDLHAMPAAFSPLVRRCRSLNDPDVFAAGDCSAMVETPREKAGVYAVRAGPPLAENLHRRVRDKPLKRWTPQRRHLALISTGERYAVASWGPMEGRRRVGVDAEGLDRSPLDAQVPDADRRLIGARATGSAAAASAPHATACRPR